MMLKLFDTSVVTRPVYLIKTAIVIVGTPEPKSNEKLAYNRRRRDIRNLSAALDFLIEEYQRRHNETPHIDDDGKPGHILPWARLELDFPTTMTAFRSAHKENRRNNMWTFERRLNGIFAAASYPQALSIQKWLKEERGPWPKERGLDINRRGGQGVELVPVDPTIEMIEGTYLRFGPTDLNLRQTAENAPTRIQ